ncbi:MAG: hypothetical protein ACI39F_03745 [Acutalibacteraceae bacterium]
MKRKVLLWVITLLAMFGFTFWRLGLIATCTEPLNGFFYPEAKTFGYIYIGAIAAFIVLVLILAVTDKKYPDSPLQLSKPLAVVNILYAISVFAQAVISVTTADDIWKQLYVAALLTLGVFMIYYAVCLIKGKSIAKASALIPLLVLIYKLGYIFINSFGIIKSGEVVLSVFAMIFGILFFECYARYNARLKFNFIRKFFLTTGIVASVLLMVSSVSNFLSPYILKVDSRAIMQDNIFLFATSIYILLFVVISFSKKSLYSSTEK